MKSGLVTMAVSLDIVEVLLASVVWGFTSRASSALASTPSFGGTVVVILRSEVYADG